MPFLHGDTTGGLQHRVPILLSHDDLIDATEDGVDAVQLLDAQLGQLALGDVHPHPDQASGLTTFVDGQHPAHHMNPAILAVGVLHPRLVLIGDAVVRDRRLNLGADRRAILRMEAL